MAGAVLRGEVRLGAEQIIYAGIMGLVAVAFAWFASIRGLPPVQIAVVLLTVSFSAFFYTFKGYIARKFLIRKVALRDIEEEDVLALDEMDPKVVERYGLRRLLTAGEIKRLRKVPMKAFPVYKNLPAFTPYILISLLLSVLFGDLVLLIFSAT